MILFLSMFSFSLSFVQYLPSAFVFIHSYLLLNYPLPVLPFPLPYQPPSNSSPSLSYSRFCHSLHIISLTVSALLRSPQPCTVSKIKHIITKVHERVKLRSNKYFFMVTAQRPCPSITGAIKPHTSTPTEAPTKALSMRLCKSRTV